MVIELVLTVGLMSTILGSASRAQNSGGRVAARGTLEVEEATAESAERR